MVNVWMKQLKNKIPKNATLNAILIAAKKIYKKPTRTKRVKGAKRAKGAKRTKRAKGSKRVKSVQKDTKKAKYNSKRKTKKL